MYQYRAFIKDALDLSGKPKAFVVVPSFTIRRDLLTTANSSFSVLSLPTNIDNGDLFCLYNPFGEVIYQGIINQVGNLQIQTTQIQSFYKGTWLCEVSPQDYLEHEIAVLLGRYAQGYISDTVNDPLMAQKHDIEIEYVGSNTVNLPTFDEHQTMDFETFIYDLYSKYNIVFDFDIPFEGQGNVNIHTINLSAYKIANNTHAIIDISPVTQISQNNKLVIYSSEGVYRASYFATAQGITQNADDPLRLKSINTVIQFTDDELDAVVASNLSSEMYNHKLTFTLRLNNNLYNWYEWKLGQPLDIWFNSQYFNSVYTGYELTKTENTEPTEVKITCGKVRTSLTSKLSLGGLK